MKNETSYEWCWEYSDEHEDIIDLVHADTLKSLGAAEEDSLKPELTLIREVGNDLDGLLERGYAYPTKGKLPEFFSCGARVPKRFQKELDASNISR